MGPNLRWSERDIPVPSCSFFFQDKAPSLATRSPATDNHREVQLALGEVKPVTQNLLAPLAGDLVWVQIPPRSGGAFRPRNAAGCLNFGCSSSHSPAHRPLYNLPDGLHALWNDVWWTEHKIAHP